MNTIYLFRNRSIIIKKYGDYENVFNKLFIKFIERQT
jgi:hypothetical protein